MLPRQMSRAAVAAAIVLSMSAADAQFYGDGCPACGPVSTPVASCVPIQPVQTTCYQTVPVTTYKQERQTVKVPYYETEYQEREVTVMRPVTSSREVEVPTVSHHNVTEYHAVNRDMGRWVTRYQPIKKCTACQVDPRLGLIGWLNRTGYSFRTAFMPNYTTSRHYVPNMMACTVPVTRQVAVRGTRRVTVNETRMVAERKTERIPVQRLAWRKETRTVMRPQTAYRTVPIGTQLAYGYGSHRYGGYGLGSVTTFVPAILEDSRTVLAPTPDPISENPRTADGRTMFYEDDEDDEDANSIRYDRRHRSADDHDSSFRKSSRSHSLESVPQKRRFSDDDSHSIEPIDDFSTLGTSVNRPGQVVIPAVYQRLDVVLSESPGWNRTSPKTALKSSRAATRPSQISLTQSFDN